MKKLLQITARNLAFAAVMAFTLVFASLSASAQSHQSPVFRADYPGETHTGSTLESWGPTVTIRETEKPMPIAVTWSGSYRATTGFYIGVSLNGGPCVFSGPSSVPAFFPDDFSSTSMTLEWVIMPGDYKLDRGMNTITLCGASSEWGSNGTINLGLNTMVAQLVR
jgi:hypothetical protein